jgi:glutamate racemase
MQKNISPIGIFDSGYGGLTILKQIVETLPEYDFVYLGDNARTPYGTRSFDIVYHYTLESVKKLFEMGCNLVILACNTASAKALRTIQQNDLPKIDPGKRVLGVIRPSVEVIDSYTKTKNVGVLGTNGTVASESYPIEIQKLFPEIVVNQEACPMWVPLVEYNEYNSDGADFFVQKHLSNLLKTNPKIDTIVLGCTHYPLLLEKIRKYTPENITILSQGDIVASSLADYLRRHPEMDAKCSKNSTCRFFTTEAAETFEKQGSQFLNRQIAAQKIVLFEHLALT